MSGRHDHPWSLEPRTSVTFVIAVCLGLTDRGNLNQPWVAEGRPALAGRGRWDCDGGGGGVNASARSRTSGVWDACCCVRWRRRDHLDDGTRFADDECGVDDIVDRAARSVDGAPGFHGPTALDDGARSDHDDSRAEPGVTQPDGAGTRPPPVRL